MSQTFTTEDGTFLWYYTTGQTSMYSGYPSLAPLISDITTKINYTTLTGNSNLLGSRGDFNTLDEIIPNLISIRQFGNNADTTSVIDDIGPVSPEQVTSSTMQFVGTGPSYSTGTVQIYVASITRKWTQQYIDSTPPYDHFQHITTTGHTWVVYWPTKTANPVPGAAGGGGPIPDITLQVKRNPDNIYTCAAADDSILPKYKESTGGQNKIRASFSSGTRIAVITAAINNGFLIYEEILGVASGNVYVYDKDRHLSKVVDASQINQYLA